MLLLQVLCGEAVGANATAVSCDHCPQNKIGQWTNVGPMGYAATVGSHTGANVRGFRDEIFQQSAVCRVTCCDAGSTVV